MRKIFFALAIILFFLYPSLTGANKAYSYQHSNSEAGLTNSKSLLALGLPCIPGIPKKFCPELCLFFCSEDDSPEDTSGKLPCSHVEEGKCLEVKTAIGPITVDPPGEFVTRIMSFILGLAGGIAILLIIAAGYMLMTSRDNPETIQEARQRLIAAIAGLLFVIFSIVILEVIGVHILHIPGFKSSTRF